MKSWLALVLLMFVPASSLAQLPDPALSDCDFPEGSMVCTDLIVILVTVVGSQGPIESAFVQVLLSVDSGSLDPGQQTLAEAVTNSSGFADPTFPDGVSGSAVIFFEVFAKGIKICESPTYEVESCPVPVQPTTWGRIKTTYGGSEAFSRGLRRDLAQ